MQRHSAPERMVQTSEHRVWCCRWCDPHPDDRSRRNAKRRERQAWKKSVRVNTSS